MSFEAPLTLKIFAKRVPTNKFWKKNKEEDRDAVTKMPILVMYLQTSLNANCKNKYVVIQNCKNVQEEEERVNQQQRLSKVKKFNSGNNFYFSKVSLKRFEGENKCLMFYCSSGCKRPFGGTL